MGEFYVFTPYKLVHPFKIHYNLLSMDISCIETKTMRSYYFISTYH